MSAVIIIICCPGKSVFCFLVLYFICYNVFCFAGRQYLSTWCSKTIINDGYDLLLWSRSSYFSHCAVFVCWAALLSALWIMSWEPTLIKSNYSRMFNFGCDKGLYVSTFLMSSLGPVVFLKWPVCHFCNSRHTGTIEIRKYKWSKIFTMTEVEIFSRDFT